MNKSGFTLVEMLVTIVVMAILLSIASLSVINIMNNAKTNIASIALKNLKDAAITYAKDKKIKIAKCSAGYEVNSILDNSSCTYKVKVEDLINENFFSDDSSACNKESSVIIYHYVDPTTNIDEYRSYVEDNTCLKK